MSLYSDLNKKNLVNQDKNSFQAKKYFPDFDLQCRHHWLQVNLKRYNRAEHSYIASCGDMYCPVHGQRVAESFWYNHKGDVQDSQFATFVIHFNSHPSPNQIRDYWKLLSSVIKKDRSLKCKGVFHPLYKDWHLHVFINHSSVRSQRSLPSLLSPSRKGTNILKDRGNQTKIIDWNYVLGLIFAIKCEYYTLQKDHEQDWVNYSEWLSYVLRLGKGFPMSEQPPIKPHYRARFGW